jgi:hypothetical protein
MFIALPRPFGRPFRLGLVSDPSPLGTGTNSPVGCGVVWYGWVGCVVECVCGGVVVGDNRD